jgi:hypothetical protein
MIASVPITNNDGDITEDQNIPDTFFDNDSDLPCDTIVANMLGSNLASIAMNANGDLVSTAMAESLDECEDADAGMGAGSSHSIEVEGSNAAVRNSSNIGCGKRMKTKNCMYAEFWWHNDEDPSDAEDGC